MANSAMPYYPHRIIMNTNMSIVSMDIRDGKVHGMVHVYDRISGAMERSCEYANNMPCGRYCEYHNDKIVYQKILHSPEIIAEACANSVLN